MTPGQELDFIMLTTFRFVWGLILLYVLLVVAIDIHKWWKNRRFK